MNTVKWISVDERLPEKSGEYLVFLKYDTIPDHGYPYIIRYSARHKAFNAFDAQEEPTHAFNSVTHWAELPCPPEGWRLV